MQARHSLAATHARFEAGAGQVSLVCAGSPVRFQKLQGSMSKLLRSVAVRCVVGVAVLAAVSGCAGLRTPTSAEIAQIRTVDLVLQTPDTNFLYAGSPRMTPVVVGAPLPTVLAFGVGGALVTGGIDYLATTTARAAEGPVGRTVEDVDLRQSVLAQLERSRQGAGGPVITLSEKGFPAPVPKKHPRTAMVKQAMAAAADATLYVTVVPLFRDRDGRPVVYGASELISRSGQVLQVTDTLFLGPEAPDLETDGVVQWWADGRYRRFINLGLRAVLMPVGQGLFETLPDGVSAERAEARGRLPALTANGEKMRSTACSLEGDDARTVYRFEQQRSSLRVVAYCPGETPRLWEPALVPGVSWTTSPLPPPAGLAVRPQG